MRPLQPSDPAEPSQRQSKTARAWKLIRISAIALFALQVAGSGDSIFTAEPAERLGYALFSIGWLMLAGILTYGVWFRMRWALWASGILAALAIPIFLATPFISGVDIQGTVYRTSPLSVPLDVLSALACAALLAGLWQLKRARQS